MTNKERTKILYLITKSSWGGAQRYVFDLANNLPQYETHVGFGGEGLLESMLIDAGLPFTRLKLTNNVSPLNDLSVLLDLIKLLRKERPQVVHLNSSKMGIIGALAARIAHVPRIVFTAHAWAFNEDRPAWQKVLIKVLHWLTVVLSHQTIVVSNSMVKQFTWPLVQKKLVMIHPGRQLEGLLLYKEEARGTLEVKIQNAEANLHDFHNDFWLGSIAELHPTKQLNRLIDAMAVLTKNFTNLRLVLIHDGRERQKLEQQVRDLGLTSHVFFTGTIPQAARLLPAFDAFVLPSRTEAFGYVLVEAGLASVPVVATKVGGITDIITDKETGLLVEPENTPALTKALQEIIENKDLRHKLAQANYENVKRFSLENMIKNTQVVYFPTEITPPQLSAAEPYNESPNSDA